MIAPAAPLALEVEVETRVLLEGVAAWRHDVLRFNVVGFSETEVFVADYSGVTTTKGAT